MIDWSFDAWPAIEPHWHPGAARSEYDNIEFHVDLGCGRLKKGRIGVDRYPSPGVNVLMDLDAGAVLAAAPAPGHDAAAPLGSGWQYSTPFGASQHHMTWLTRPECPLHGYRRAQGCPEAYVIGWGLPFPDSSIESIISHHALEHIGGGFIPLVDDIYRVLRPGGIFRAITPLFPSHAAVADADHCRYFLEDTWETFCGTPGDTPSNCWLASFSVPYTHARFEMLDKDVSPPTDPRDQWTPRDAREIRVALRAVK